MSGNFKGYAENELLGDKRASAYHEAGHAIVGMHFGRTIVRIGVYDGQPDADGNEISVGLCQFADASDDVNDIVIGVAGICAQELVDDAAYLSEYSGDLQGIRRVYEKLNNIRPPRHEWEGNEALGYQAELRKAHKEARRIIKENRDEIDALASALLSDNGEEVQRIIS